MFGWRRCTGGNVRVAVCGSSRICPGQEDRHRAARMKRAIHWVFALAAVAPVSAHDLVTAESVQTYLASVGELQKVIASKEPRSTRARAHFDLGKLLDEIRDLLNRDLDTHGRVQGLPSNFLMSELKARGAELAFAAETNRFLANVQHYREALKLDPSGPAAAEATFRLLQGYFYDSFATDPLQPASQSQAQLGEQIRLGEDLLKKYPQHTEREETSFILVVHYVQAARAAEREADKLAFAHKARAMAGEFAKTYPASLRAAALPHVLEGL